MCYELINKTQDLKILNNKYGKISFDNTFFPDDTFELYIKNHIDLTSVNKIQKYNLSQEQSYTEWGFFDLFWWDFEVLSMFKKHGVEKFALLDIWDRNWQQYAEHFGLNIDFRPVFKLKYRLQRKWNRRK